MSTRSATSRGPAAGDETTQSVRRRPSGWVRVAAAGALVAVLVASAAGFRFVQSDPLPTPSPSPVIAVAPRDAPWPAALVTGTLRLQDGCLLVDDAVALFRDGATWSAASREVVFSDGTRWAVGEQIEGGGGVLSVDDLPDTGLGEAATAAAAGCADDLGLTTAVLVAPLDLGS